MSDEQPYFFHRHPDEGPPRGVRVRRLPAAPLEEWATRLRFQGEQADDPWTIDEGLHQRLMAQLSEHVHGLRGVGLVESAVDTGGADVPRDLAEAWELWADATYAPDLRGDEHSLRVLTDDDEIESAYVLVDAAVVRSRPERFAYLLHTAAELPGGTGPAGFLPEAQPDIVVRSGAGPGAVFIADFSVSSSSGVDDAGFHRLDGVRLPELLGDPELLERSELGFEWIPVALAGTLPTARAARVARVDCAEHDVEESSAGEVVVFDDLWAGAHPDLAASMLWTAYSWDPLGDPQD